MCRDLRAFGHESRYAKPLRYLPGAEYKEPGAEADEDLLDELVDIAEAVRKGVLKP